MMNGRLIWALTLAIGLTSSSDSFAQGYAPQHGGHSPGGSPAWYGQSGSVYPLTPQYQPGPANRAWDDLSGDQGGFYENSPVDEFLRDLARDSFVRMEYLSWSFREPSGGALGSPIQGIVDPRRPFEVDIDGQLGPDALGRVHSLAGTQIDDVQGLRATIGVPLGNAVVEANIFTFDEAQQNTNVNDLGEVLGDPTALPRVIATSTLLNGEVSRNIFLYDDFFRTNLSTDLWGTELNVVFNSYSPPPGFVFRPMVGFRYIDFGEKLAQTGSFDQQDNLLTPLISTIVSGSENSVYVPQVGLRTEFTSRWLTVGIEPKIGVGVNVYRDNVYTSALRAVDDPLTSTIDRGEKIAVSGELSLTGQVHISEKFSINVGYTIIFVDNVSRPTSSILYNDNGPSPIPPAVVVNPSFDLMYFQGLNVGGEIRF